MDDTFENMLGDLRSQFNQRIPGGLTNVADERLNRTLDHYTKEVGRVGKGGTQDILRLTYDSMAKWFRRALQPKPPQTEQFDSEIDPATVFASIKAARAASSVFQPSGPTAAPFRLPDLETAVPPALKPPVYGVQQKDVLQPQEDTVKYREVEYNLVINSKDRDWLANIDQNRYNFVVQFNTNYKPQGYGLQAHINARLRNITRLEFIKAILPVEGLSVVVPQDCSSITHPENAFYSVLALPSVNVLVDEFQGNNYGTNNDIDKSLAVCQYDATWRSENVWNKPGVNRGYSLFFPKFMKAQRIYTPAPLSNLQVLSFRLQDPEGNLLSENPDSSFLSQMRFSSDLSGTSCYLDSTGDYIFLETKTWFPLWSYSQLDKILLQGLTFASVSQPAGAAALNEWLQDPAGQSVVAIAYSDASGRVYDGANSVGYANWIIIRNRFQDPTSGGTGLDYFSGSLSGDAALGFALVGYPQTGGILNLSRQVQLSIRVITREYDLVSNVRSDNV